MTSVKEFRTHEPATSEILGRGSFVFTDEYSVFDWGQMPDTIPQKGASLCVMGAYNFERLDAKEIPTHYEGVVTDGGDVVALSEAASPPREMAIQLTQVPDLPFVDGDYDYDSYHDTAGENYLVPLEVVFRNTVPVGSSLRRRGTPDEYGLDLDEWPDEAVNLPEPVVEFSTKYEEGDRYLDREEADRIAGRADLDRIEELALAVNHHITEQAEQAGFEHQDGKIEVLYYDGTIKVADVLGTFDENRFSYEGQQVSKEVVRQYYKHTQPSWPAAVKSAKQQARNENVEDWKQFCDETPDPLPAAVLQAVSDLYAAGANAYVGDDFFEAPPIGDAVDAVRDL